MPWHLSPRDKYYLQKLKHRLAYAKLAYGFLVFQMETMSMGIRGGVLCIAQSTGRSLTQKGLLARICKRGYLFCHYRSLWGVYLTTPTTSCFQQIFW